MTPTAAFFRAAFRIVVRPNPWTTLLAASSVFFAVPVLAATVTLTADLDNTLFEDAGGALSNGSGPYAFAGGNANRVRRRAMVRFPLASIPAGATVTGATLTMVVSMAGPSPSAVNFEAHRLLASWGEGASNSGGTTGGAQGGGAGAPSASGDATWLHRSYPSLLWSTAGGDFAPAPSVSQSVEGNGAYSWSSPQLAADVQGWVDTPATNFGWLVLGGEGETHTAKRFNSRENSDAATRPRLVVDYALGQSVPAMPHGYSLMLLVGLAGVGVTCARANDSSRSHAG